MSKEQVLKSEAFGPSKTRTSRAHVVAAPQSRLASFLARFGGSVARAEPSVDGYQRFAALADAVLPLKERTQVRLAEESVLRLSQPDRLEATVSPGELILAGKAVEDRGHKEPRPYLVFEYRRADAHEPWNEFARARRRARARGHLLEKVRRSGR